MHRRHYLVANGALITQIIGGYTVASQETEDGEETIACAGGVATPDENEVEVDGPEPIEFEGSGAAVTDPFDLEGGVTIVEGTHDGESNFAVQLVGDTRDHLLVNVIGAYEGAGGGVYESGEYVADVDADGSWELTIRQPRAEEGEAEPLPQTLECEGATWAGPFVFDGLAQATGTHEGESNFIVEIVLVDESFPELVFNEIGTFDGETTFRAEGVGYVIADADGPWSLELE